MVFIDLRAGPPASVGGGGCASHASARPTAVGGPCVSEAGSVVLRSDREVPSASEKSGAAATTLLPGQRS